MTAIGAARTAGFPTFVVGIAPVAPAWPTRRSARWRTEGGLPRAGPRPAYYPVSNAAELAAAIRTLIGVAGRAPSRWPEPVDDGSTSLDRIDVFGDGNVISRDPSHRTATTTPTPPCSRSMSMARSCDQIMSGTIKDVTVAFRCLVP